MSRLPRKALLGVACGVILACQTGSAGPSGPDLSLVGWITLGVDSLTLKDGEQRRVTAEVFATDGRSLAATYPVTWTVSPDSLASVGTNGDVSARRPGRGTLSGRVGEAYKSIPLVVEAVPVRLSPAPEQVGLTSPGDSVTFSVHVVDRHGSGVIGVPVQFNAVDGNVLPASAVTDSTGSATTLWQLADRAGEQRLQVAASSLETIDHRLLALPPLSPPQSDGSGQTGTVAAPLPAPLQVTLRDTNGSPIAGVPVRWTTTDGSVADSLVQTNTDGEAETFWTLDTFVGEQAAVALFGSDTVRFQAVAGAGPADSIEVFPAIDTIRPGDSLRVSAQGWDAFGNAVPDLTVVWAFANSTDSVAGALRGSGWFVSSGPLGTWPVVGSGPLGGGADTATIVVSTDGQPNQPPFAAFEYSCVDLRCTFDGSGSFDSDGRVVEWTWSFPNSGTGSGTTTTHTFDAVGQHVVQLRVRDDQGAQTTASKTVELFPEAPSNVVYPGMDLVSMVAAHPPGTSFTLKAGVHRGHQITPRTKDQFVGETGAVLDGGGTVKHAFYGTTGIDSVEIRGLEIRNYDPPATEGAVRGENTVGWRVIGNNIHSNTGGVRIGQDITIEGNHIHHNRQLGVMGQADGALIANNEISYNNVAREYDMFWAAGGIKITKSRDPVIRGNNIHHNVGPGVWLDIDDLRALVEDNTITDNVRAGVYHEISYEGVIRNNHILRNGGPNQWFHTGGIVVAASKGVEVYGNVLVDNVHGIIATQQDRGSGQYGIRLLQDLWVHDNQVTMTQGFTGVVRDQSVNDAVFLSRNNRFDRNHYVLGSRTHYFLWRKAEWNESGWQAQGQDVNGTFSRP